MSSAEELADAFRRHDPLLVAINANQTFQNNLLERRKRDLYPEKYATETKIETPTEILEPVTPGGFLNSFKKAIEFIRLRRPGIIGLEPVTMRGRLDYLFSDLAEVSAGDLKITHGSNNIAVDHEVEVQIAHETISADPIYAGNELEGFLLQRTIDGVSSSYSHPPIAERPNTLSRREARQAVRKAYKLATVF